MEKQILTIDSILEESFYGIIISSRGVMELEELDVKAQELQFCYFLHNLFYNNLVRIPSLPSLVSYTTSYTRLKEISP